MGGCGFFDSFAVVLRRRSDDEGEAMKMSR